MDTVMYWAADHPVWVDLVSVGLILTGLVLGVRYYKKKRARGDDPEMAKRHAYLESLYADKVHDFLFDLLHTEQITRAEYKLALRRFGTKFALEDCLATRLHPSAIRRRVTKAVQQDKAVRTKIKPEAIPGPKPGVTTPAPPPQLGSKFLSRALTRQAS